MKNHGMIWTWISIQLNATLVKSQLSRSKLYASFKHASCSYAWKTVNTVQSSGGGRAVSMHGAHHAKNRHLRGPATDYFYQLIFMTWLRGRKYIWSYNMNEIILKKEVLSHSAHFLPIARSRDFMKISHARCRHLSSLSTTSDNHQTYSEVA